jgi:hypothetical protein
MMLLGRGDYHTFSADGAPHVYLVPSAAVFRLDPPSAAVLDVLREEQLDAMTIADRLADRFPRLLVQETVDELLSAQAIRTVVAPRGGSQGGRTAQAYSAHHAGHERDQQVQSELQVLLRIRRRSAE